jgi:hypothetical protein
MFGFASLDGTPKKRCKMEIRSGFPWMLKCTIIGMAVSASPCFAQENQNSSLEAQREAEARLAAAGEARARPLIKEFGIKAD